jgi:hypothetical protein
MREELRSLLSLQDGDENRGQLFSLLSQRRELFRANNPPRSRRSFSSFCILPYYFFSFAVAAW